MFLSMENPEETTIRYKEEEENRPPSVVQTFYFYTDISCLPGVHPSHDGKRSLKHNLDFRYSLDPSYIFKSVKGGKLLMVNMLKVLNTS